MLKTIPYLALAISIIFTAGWVHGHKAHSAELGYKTSLTSIYERYGHIKNNKPNNVEFEAFKKGSRIPDEQLALYLPKLPIKSLRISK
jgi:hypothetical protein